MKHLLALASLAVLAACGSESPNQASAKAEHPHFAMAREEITARLRDPESARFGTMKFGKPGYVCGTINSKNAFGGYTGARAFSYSISGKPLLVYDWDNNSDGEWDRKAGMANEFANRGCSVGPDQEKALEVYRDFKAHNMHMRSYI